MMVKKIATGILAVALTGSLYAGNYSEGKKFIGVELGSTKLDSSARFYPDNGVPFQLAGESDSAIEYGFRIGAQDEEWRTTLLYSYYNNDDSGFEETTHKGSIHLDYFIWSTDAGGMDIKPFIGGHVGYMSYEVSGDTGLGLREIFADDSNVFYGGQAGVSLAISDVVELDLSYRYSLTNLDDIPVELTGGHMESSLDSMGSIVFGLNYFY